VCFEGQASEHSRQTRGSDSGTDELAAPFWRQARPRYRLGYQPRRTPGTVAASERPRRDGGGIRQPHLNSDHLDCPEAAGQNENDRRQCRGELGCRAAPATPATPATRH